jgi:hypothetical protein
MSDFSINPLKLRYQEKNINLALGDRYRSAYSSLFFLSRAPRARGAKTGAYNFFYKKIQLFTFPPSHSLIPIPSLIPDLESNTAKMGNVRSHSPF